MIRGRAFAPTDRNGLAQAFPTVPTLFFTGPRADAAKHSGKYIVPKVDPVGAVIFPAIDRVQIFGDIGPGRAVILTGNVLRGPVEIFRLKANASKF